MRKRALAILLTGVLVLSAGCGKTEETGTEVTETPKVTSAPENTPEPTPVPEITDSPAVTDVPEVTEIPEITEAPIVTDMPEPTETPEPTPVIEAQKELYNNDGYFVQYGDKVYFRMPTEDAMNESELFGSFTEIGTAATYLCAYDLKNGELEKLAVSNAIGKMAVLDDCLIIREFDAESSAFMASKISINDVSEIFSTEMNDVRGNKSGTYVCATQYDYENSVVNLYVWGVGGKEYLLQEEEYMGFLGISEDSVYYQVGSYMEPGKLIQWNFLTGERFVLGEMPFDEEGYGYGEIKQFEYDDTNAYFGYGMYEGTGHFYNCGYYIKVQAGAEDSIEILELGCPGDESDMPAFKVENGEMISVDGMPKTAACLNNGWLGYYDSEGEFVNIAEGYGYKSDEDGYQCEDTEIAELVDGRIWGIRNEMIHDEENDIGWRWAYRRTHTTVFFVDISTGEETVVCEIWPETVG